MYQLVLVIHPAGKIYHIWGYSKEDGSYYTGNLTNIINAIHTHDIYKLIPVPEHLPNIYTYENYFNNVPDLIDYILIDSFTGNTDKYLAILQNIKPQVVNKEYYQIVQSLIRASSAGVG